MLVNKCYSVFVSGELDIIAEICQVLSTEVSSISVQVLRNIIPKLMMVCYKPNDWWQWKEKGTVVRDMQSNNCRWKSGCWNTIGILITLFVSTFMYD